ncbi:MAG: hypothetical protein PWQ60_146 [Thermoanaerobacteraceae bacterium]|nr:hypothetical protein [Thermoanaerobacteraceae bacterium]
MVSGKFKVSVVKNLMTRRNFINIIEYIYKCITTNLIILRARRARRGFAGRKGMGSDPHACRCAKEFICF